MSQEVNVIVEKPEYKTSNSSKFVNKLTSAGYSKKEAVELATKDIQNTFEYLEEQHGLVL